MKWIFFTSDLHQTERVIILSGHNLKTNYFEKQACNDFDLHQVKPASKVQLINRIPWNAPLNTFKACKRIFWKYIMLFILVHVFYQLALTLWLPGVILPKLKYCKILMNHLNPVTLAFIWKLSSITFKGIPMLQGFDDF